MGDAEVAKHPCI